MTKNKTVGVARSERKNHTSLKITTIKSKRYCQRASQSERVGAYGILYVSHCRKLEHAVNHGGWIEITRGQNAIAPLCVYAHCVCELLRKKIKQMYINALPHIDAVMLFLHGILYSFRYVFFFHAKESLFEVWLWAKTHIHIYICGVEWTHRDMCASTEKASLCSFADFMVLLVSVNSLRFVVACCMSITRNRCPRLQSLHTTEIN